MRARAHGRILLVEDENLLRCLVAQFLRAEGYEVVEAADGGEGIECFARLRPFDVVLLDLNLPVCPGVEVCRRIREIDAVQPVIICSATILDGHIDALTALHVDQFLTKPYHPDELLRRIAVELGRTQPGTPENESPPRPAGWRIDPARQGVAPSHSLSKQPAID